MALPDMDAEIVWVLQDQHVLWRPDGPEPKDSSTLTIEDHFEVKGAYVISDEAAAAKLPQLLTPTMIRVMLDHPLNKEAYALATAGAPPRRRCTKTLIFVGLMLATGFGIVLLLVVLRTQGILHYSGPNGSPLGFHTFPRRSPVSAP